MNPTLEQFQSAVTNGLISWKAVAAVPDADASLDARDGDPFDGRWVSENEAVQDLTSSNTVDLATAAVIDDVSHNSFVAVSRLTDRHDLASYVSDDVRLLAEAISVGHESPWLSALLERYLRGTFPTGALPPSDKTIASLLS